ncbi:MAG TPA: thioredoxin domain-containing protein, partial [Gemmatimonadaceae bacterium]|nr:thioredoxin domain-containing protein [Gemmatimonadaceae bacterium]
RALAAIAFVACGAATMGAQSTPRRVVVNGVDLTGIGQDRGRADAPVVLVELSDFGCPYCGVYARETLPAIEREYVATGRVFYKHVAFVAGSFANSRPAARAAECAGEQGRFWAMHDSLYARQREWQRRLSPFETLAGYAARLGLDVGRFRGCYVQHEPLHPRTRLATDRADRLGVRVTPSFLLDGRPLAGALPLAEFRRHIEEALRRR